jgi:RNA polymerase sigma-70 factor, ECF subfamily
MNSTPGELIQERLPQWRAYAQSLTRNRAAAEDLVQDTVVRVLTAIDRFDGTNFKSWSNAILHNRFIDDRRRARYQGGSIEDLPVAATAHKATQEIEVELVETLRALDDISPQHREIIILVGIKELSYARTARRLKIPMGTVRSRLSRARAELLALVEGERRLGRTAKAAALAAALLPKARPHPPAGASTSQRTRVQMSVFPSTGSKTYARTRRVPSAGIVMTELYSTPSSGL